MWTDHDILDAIAGKIDAPCGWRLQFWICIAFNRWSMAMLEGSEGETAAYLWILSRDQANAIAAEPDVSGLSSAPFDLQDVRELPRSLADYWRQWPFFRVGEVPEDKDWQERDGIWMTVRSFDGANSYHADLTNPDKDLQPLRWQAQREVFDLLAQLWDWQTLMEQSSRLGRRRK